MENREDVKQAVGKVNKSFSAIMLTEVDKVATASGNTLSAKDKTFAQDIILNTYKKMMADSIAPNEINFVGCNFPGQVKRFARLGLSLNEHETWLDIRNNSKTQKKDINIKVQYQGEEKLLIKFNKKHGGIVNVIKDVILENEELITSRDFKTGDYVIQDHKIPNILKRNVSDKTVVGAYAIAYHKDGTQTALIIDDERIQRAKKSAKTQVVWNSDYKKMCLKTVVHDLYKELSKFNVIPDDLLNDYNEVALNKEDVQNEINENANQEVFDVDFNVSEDTQHVAVEEQSSASKTLNFNPKTGEVYKQEVAEEPKQQAYDLGTGPSF